MSLIRRLVVFVLQLVMITVLIGGTWLVFRAIAHGQAAPPAPKPLGAAAEASKIVDPAWLPDESAEPQVPTVAPPTPTPAPTQAQTPAAPTKKKPAPKKTVFPACTEYVWVGPAHQANVFDDLRTCLADAEGNCAAEGDHLRLDNPSKHDIAWSCDELSQAKTALLVQGQMVVRKITKEGQKRIILRVREKSKRCTRND